MNNEFQKEFIDVLMDRVYVVVITKRPQKICVITDRLTFEEITPKLRDKLLNSDITKDWMSLYVAHYKNLEIPIPSPNF